MTSDFVIDSNFPPPNKQPSSRGAKIKYPLHMLQPGQSFFIPELDAHKAKNLRSAMTTRAKKLNIKVTSEADDTGVRIWRLA